MISKGLGTHPLVLCATDHHGTVGKSCKHTAL